MNQCVEAAANLVAILKLQWWKFNSLQVKQFSLWGLDVFEIVVQKKKEKEQASARI